MGQPPVIHREKEKSRLQEKRMLQRKKEMSRVPADSHF
jgi:hypothetical protein